MTKRPDDAEPVVVDDSTGVDFVEPIVALTPQLRCDAALKKIHRELLRGIEANDDGVRRRRPGEYLHDFRVAVRRTRTGLTQLKRVYPEEQKSRFAADFRWLSNVTSPARDLEVFLAAIDGYGTALDGALDADSAASLAPFERFLRAREDRQRESCTHALSSDRYRSLLGEWGEFLGTPPGVGRQPENAGGPVREVAAERIARAFVRVGKRGAAVELGSPAAAFHLLRLDCKKLRYLLEFFGGLFDGDEGTSAVRALRHTQDALGRINDLRVQARWVREFPGPYTRTARSLGEYLEERQAEERQAFLDGFATFIDRDNEAAIQRFLHSHATAR